jgi:hypothetical protein
MEGHALGDDEVGQAVNAVDDEEEGEKYTAEPERCRQLSYDVPIEHEEPHGSVVP